MNLTINIDTIFVSENRTLCMKHTTNFTNKVGDELFYGRLKDFLFISNY